MKIHSYVGYVYKELFSLIARAVYERINLWMNTIFNIIFF